MRSNIFTRKAAMLGLSLVVVMASACSSYNGTWSGNYTLVGGAGNTMTLTLDQNSGVLTGSGTVTIGSTAVPCTVLGTYSGGDAVFTLTAATPQLNVIKTWAVTTTISGDTMNGVWADSFYTVNGAFVLTQQ